jgi:hypothetical protein
MHEGLLLCHAACSRTLSELSPCHAVASAKADDCGLLLATAPHAARASRRVVTFCPKQLPWKLLAQFSLSRDRDVANIID